MSKFNDLYNLILENNKKFNVFNREYFPYQLPKEIKQCLISKHFIEQMNWRIQQLSDKIKIPIENIKQFIFKNIQIALIELVKNQQILTQIQNNQFNEKSIDILLSTDKFCNQTDIHLICPFIINSYSDLNDNNYYFILFDTIYFMNQYQFNYLIKNNFKRIPFPNDIPLHLIGESSSSSIFQNIFKQLSFLFKRETL